MKKLSKIVFHLEKEFDVLNKFAVEWIAPRPHFQYFVQSQK